MENSQMIENLKLGDTHTALSSYMFALTIKESSRIHIQIHIVIYSHKTYQLQGQRPS
jgi:hypothetical protein